MEKFIKKSGLVALAAVLISCLALASCGGDDNNDGPDNPPVGPVNPSTDPVAQQLLGEWQITDSPDQTWMFISGGSGYDTYRSEIEESFSWVLNGKRLSIVWEEGDYGTYEILRLTESELTLLLVEEDYLIKFTKVGSANGISAQLLGEWIYSDPGCSSYGQNLMFLRGGRGYGGNYEGDTDYSFTWSLNGSSLVIRRDDGEEFYYTIVKLTSGELVIRDRDCDYDEHLKRVR
ncbi:MAG: lipocalin family protein [Candidatus Amulumruptor caecigallinarius]|nr:lipocalin family protein [Candidatus Amulumruptor caecigallinarius]